MKKAIIIHNRSAGSGKSTKKELLNLFRYHNIECEYASSKKNKWKKFYKTSDLIVIAGGDGTIRKVFAELISHPGRKKYSLLVLPHGTANNIAYSLKIPEDPKKQIGRIEKAKAHNFSYGTIENFEENFFIESAGFGIFPAVISIMKNYDKKLGDNPEKRKLTSLKVFEKKIQSHKPANYKIIADGKDYSGRYIVVEIMNIKSLGPNVELCADAKMDDEFFNLLLLKDTDRPRLSNYIRTLSKKKKSRLLVKSILCKEISIKCEDSAMHVDDKYISGIKNKKLKIKIRKSPVKILVN